MTDNTNIIKEALEAAKGLLEVHNIGQGKSLPKINAALALIEKSEVMGADIMPDGTIHRVYKMSPSTGTTPVLVIPLEQEQSE